MKRRYVEHVCCCLLTATSGPFYFEGYAKVFATTFASLYGQKTALKISKNIDYWKLHFGTFQLLVSNNQILTSIQLQPTPSLYYI